MTAQEEAAQRLLDGYNAHMTATLGDWAKVAPTLARLPAVAREHYLRDAALALDAEDDEAAARALWDHGGPVRMREGSRSSWDTLPENSKPKAYHRMRARWARGTG